MVDVKPIEETSDDALTFTTTFYVTLNAIRDAESGDTVAIAQSNLGIFSLKKYPSKQYSFEEIPAAKEINVRATLQSLAVRQRSTYSISRTIPTVSLVSTWTLVHGSSP